MSACLLPLTLAPWPPCRPPCAPFVGLSLASSPIRSESPVPCPDPLRSGSAWPRLVWRPRRPAMVAALLQPHRPRASTAPPRELLSPWPRPPYPSRRRLSRARPEPPSPCLAPPPFRVSPRRCSDCIELLLEFKPQRQRLPRPRSSVDSARSPSSSPHELSAAASFPYRSASSRPCAAKTFAFWRTSSLGTISGSRGHNFRQVHPRPPPPVHETETTMVPITMTTRKQLGSSSSTPSPSTPCTTTLIEDPCNVSGKFDYRRRRSSCTTTYASNSALRMLASKGVELEGFLVILVIGSVPELLRTPTSKDLILLVVR